MSDTDVQASGNRYLTWPELVPLPPFDLAWLEPIVELDDLRLKQAGRNPLIRAATRLARISHNPL